MTLAALFLFLAAEDSVIGQAKKAFDRGRYHDALRLWDKADQSRCDIAFFQGLAYFRLHRLPEAILYFETSVACDGRQIQPRIALAEVYAAAGDPSRSLLAYEAALKIAPDSVEAMRGASALYLTNQLNDKAVQLLERLVRHAPQDAAAHAQLGAVYAATSRMERAEPEFTSALQLDSRNASALTGLANVYMKTDRTAQAPALLKQAVSIASRSYEPWFLLGAAYASQGSLEQALASFQRAMVLDEHQPEAHYQIAMVYGKLGRTTDRNRALQRFRALKDSSENQSESKRQAGRLVEEARVRVEQGNLKAASQILEKALELQSEDDDTRFRLAALQFDLEEYTAALANVRHAIVRAPGVWTYYHLLGLLEKRMGGLDAAGIAFKTALRLNTKAADAYNHLGDIAMRRSEFSNAAASFRKAVEIDPAEASYRANLEAAERSAQRSAK